MTEYLTSSITPTLGNENKLILQSEKENLWELWKSIRMFYSSTVCRNFSESRIVFNFSYPPPQYEQGLLTDLEWKCLSLVFQDRAVA